MVYTRALSSPTPSVGSDAPIPVTLQEDPTTPQIPSGGRTTRLSNAPSEVEQPTTEEAQKDVWLIFVGNLHPNVKEADLYHLFNGSNNIRNITIRVSRGCCTAYITEEEISPSDRCYASVEVIGWEKTEQIFANYDPKNRPMIHGLPVVIALSPADMPELGEILKWAKENKTGSTEEQPKSKRITAQKTEIIGEDNTSSLVGPSTSAHPKSRHNPLRRDRA